MVPFYMRRPFDMILVVYDQNPQYLHELIPEDTQQLADGFACGMALLRTIMHALKREFAFNAVFHTAAGGGLYVEFLPLTQEEGGFEKLGLSVCQSTPDTAAQVLREAMRSLSA
jgi:hypothetical protein